MNVNWNVAVDAPIFSALTYSVPEGLEPQVGASVRVPLGVRSADGVLLGPVVEASTDSVVKIKPIASIEDQPRLAEQYLNWVKWVADYYAHPVGQVARLAFPPLGVSKKLKPSSLGPALGSALEQKHSLNPDQARVFEDLRDEAKFGVHLLFGVTGSGKTEVYLQLIEQVLKRGQSALVLVPEISLTPQLYQRFGRRFGEQVAILHSQLTDRQRTDQWFSVMRGEKRILVGARSALFCPTPNLGLIVVDEEHEASYKQEEKLKYQARDSAIMRAKFENCPILLGSATPSLETWHNARTGKFVLHRLNRRFADQVLPQVHVVDLRTPEDAEEAKAAAAKAKSALPSWLSPLLHELIADRLRKGEQSALFLNRRGMSPVMFCGKCGYRAACPNCSVTLTVHGARHLVCHYCDYSETAGECCPDCKQGELKPLGLGTERIEKDLATLFPTARLQRIDRDEIQNRADLEEAIAAVENRTVDIVVGTQMIAKGLDFPSMTLVGIVLADVGFGMPDFRASERSFQLLTQVAGRAGRHKIPGDVVLQAYNTEHPSIQYAVHHDFEGFAEQELKLREELLYPPFGRLAAIRFQGADAKKVLALADQTRDRIEAWAERHHVPHFQILGPAESPLSKLRGKFRYHILMKSSSHQILGTIGRTLTSEKTIVRGVKLSVDVDPGQML